MQFLMTGGLGYIGSHTCVQLINAGHDVIVLDNLSNSNPIVLDRIQNITGKKPLFYQGDILDAALLDRIFEQHKIEAVVHFAGLKAVGESVKKPLLYYKNNVTGSATLIEAMQKASIKQFIFSSSATVYGAPETMPITESSPTGATTNPYGTSKYMVERLLQDVAHADPEMRIAILRYFNPIGAHESGLIGEDPNDTPNNLMPYISQVAAGKLPELSVFGQDYPTPDGTGIRDYIHVEDLAFGHLKALEYTQNYKGVSVFNLGTGQGYSVLNMIHAFTETTGQKVPYKIAERRPGDIAVYYADPTSSEKMMGWKATKSLTDMMRDTWRWQTKNPQGYLTPEQVKSA